MSYLIGVLSDSHGQIPDWSVIDQKLGRVDMLIHCGDGYRDGQDIAHYLNKPIVQVLGNNDFCEGSQEEIINIMRYKILVSHGHYHGVRHERERLASYAASQGASIACFGHTHRYEYTLANNIHLFNPGNLTPTVRQQEGTIGFIRLHDNGTVPDFWYEVVS